MRVPSIELINGLQSLTRRYLINVISKEDAISFNLSPVFREYVRNCAQD